MSQPLPATFSPESSSLSSAPTNLTAHEDMVQRVNSVLEGYEPGGPRDHTVTILEALVKHLPRDGARDVSDDILGCGSDEELRQLASHLLTAVLVPMKAHGRTPAVSPTPRFGGEDSIEEIASELTEPSSRNDQKWLKAACLRRDNNRCVISGYYDAIIAIESMTASDLDNTVTADTDAAHIIPFSLGTFAESERRNTAAIWDALYRCFPSLRSRINLSLDKINDTYNATTLITNLHAAFGKFQLALEPTVTIPSNVTLGCHTLTMLVHRKCLSSEEVPRIPISV